MEYLVAAYTDTGLIKETNQDSICVRRALLPGYGEMILAVVCDGMGGLKKGEVASAATVNAFGYWFDNNLDCFPSLCSNDFSQIRNQWSELVEGLHYSLLNYSEKNSIHLGTTVATLFTYADRYLVMNIGDSRIYERKKQLRQLTQDQSLVAREIAAGRITEDESRHHPQRNILLQCIGAGDKITPDFTEGQVQSDALYLLCTDGLNHELSPKDLYDRFQPILLNSKEAMTEALRNATETCKRCGETDNITAILVKTRESRYVNSKNTVKSRLRRLFRPSIDKTIPTAELLETAQIIHTQEVIGQNGRQQTR